MNAHTITRILQGGIAAVGLFIVGYLAYNQFIKPNTPQTQEPKMVSGNQSFTTFTFRDVIVGKPFTDAQIAAQKPMLVTNFNPNCSHCKALAQGITQRSDVFDGVQILFISSAPDSLIKEFAISYQLHNKPNIKFLADTDKQFFFVFGNAGVPLVLIYDKSHRLTQTLQGEAPMFQIIESLLQSP